MNHPKTLKKQITIFLKQHKMLLLTLGIVLLLLENTVFLLDNLQNKKPIIGLKLENYSITNMSRQQIMQVVSQLKQQQEKPLLLTNGIKTYQLNKADIHFLVDNALMANKLLEVGRTGNIFQKFLTQQAALFGLENIHLSGTYSKSLLLVHILEIQEEYSQNPQPETLDFTHNLNKIIPAKTGMVIQPAKLISLIVTNIGNPPNTPILLPFTMVQPKYHAPSELNNIKKEAALFLRHAISLTAAGQIIVITPEEIKDMLTVVERPNPKNPENTYLVLHINDEKLNQRLDAFANNVDTLTHTYFDDEQAKLLLLAQLFQPVAPHTPPILQTNNKIASANVLGVSTTTITPHLQEPVSQNLPAPKVVYLTFDDGPNAIYHPLILNILRSYNIHATFFLIGQNALNDPQDARQTILDGNVIGNHSFTHPDLINVSYVSAVYEITHTNDILKPINNNQDILFFRPPYGAYNQTITNIVNKDNLSEFLWNVDPRDWAEPPVDVLVNRVISATHDGSTILMHSNHLATVEALPRILDTLIAEGYSFRTLNEYPTKQELWQ